MRGDGLRPGIAFHDAGDPPQEVVKNGFRDVVHEHVIDDRPGSAPSGV
jgi:hypothetical protein